MARKMDGWDYIVTEWKYQDDIHLFNAGRHAFKKMIKGINAFLDWLDELPETDFDPEEDLDG